MSTWPDDILLIQYPNLGSSPDERLNLLGAISVLLDKPTNSYTPSMLGLLLDEWDALRAWIDHGYGEQFWHLEAQGIQITRICEKHLLIGTSQMLADLRYKMRRLSSSRQLLESIWAAAQRYVDSEIIKGSEVING